MLNVCETEEAEQAGGDHLVISGNRRDNRYAGWSPTNENFSAEGSWEDWVQLAEAILIENRKRCPGPAKIGKIRDFCKRLINLKN
ncbi:MAG: hypothetical protein KAT62_15465 [Desulfuromonadales bacterium]|nr:hypothetical protein [Desulfuromonadales bacterium]